MLSGIRRVLASRVALAASLLACAFSAVAAPIFSGDANQDSDLNVADVVTLDNQLATTATLSILDFLFHDADQSNAVDEADTDYVVDILLGLATPLPLVRPTVSGVTFWLPVPPESFLIDETNTKSGFATFWLRSSDPDSDLAVPQPSLSTFWLRTEPPDPDLAKAQPANASFWIRAGVPPITDQNTRLIGAASYQRD